MHKAMNLEDEVEMRVMEDIRPLQHC